MKLKKLIKKGFDLELISFELDIPIEELIQYKLEFKKTSKSSSIKTYSARKIIDSKNKQAYLKMQQMRRRYRKLFFKSNKIDTEQTINLQKQNDELVNSAILEIEKIR